MRYSIVAINYCGKNAENMVACLGVGHELNLVREPTNKYDPNAIAVYADDTKIGYVPKNANRALAQFIDQRGEPWMPLGMATDEVPQKAIRGTFQKSANSAFPQVEVPPH